MYLGKTEKLSEYLDFYLKPLSQKVESYIKDTTHFLQKLEGLKNIPPNSHFVTIDVTALYTSIPHRDGILAVKDALETRTIKEPYTWILLRLLHLVLSKTSFKFNDEYYEQVSGTSMGTICAPSYAIIFMDRLEQRFLNKEFLAPLVWWRYIDDIFMIWPHSREDLDSTHFLQKLEGLKNIPPNSHFVTIDVTALYTSIPHRDGILAVKDALETRTIKEPYTWILLRLLHLVLSKTSFKFNDEYYEQVSGTSMGTICAPSYAIIFMDRLEQRFLNKEFLAPLVWWRYIDDIFMIWPHSREDLDSFIMRLNQAHDTINFTADISQSAVNFLDVKVHLEKKGKIGTSLYTKPTDAHMYLHFSSFHPDHQKKAIPYSQALRIRRICSTIDSYREATSTLANNLHVRGYPRSLVKQAISKATAQDR